MTNIKNTSTAPDDQSSNDAPGGFMPGTFTDISTLNTIKQRVIEEIGIRHYVRVWNDYLQVLEDGRVAERRVHTHQPVVVLYYKEEHLDRPWMMRLAANQTMLVKLDGVANPAWMPLHALFGVKFTVCQKVNINGNYFNCRDMWCSATVTPIIAAGGADIGWFATPEFGADLGLLYDYANRKSIAPKVPLPAGCDPTLLLRTTVHELVIEGSDSFQNSGLMFGAKSRPKKPSRRKWLAKYTFDMPEEGRLRLEDAAKWYASVLPQCAVFLDSESTDTARLEKAHAIQEEILSTATKSIFDMQINWDFRMELNTPAIKRDFQLARIAPTLDTLRQRMRDGELTQKAAENLLFGIA